MEDNGRRRRREESAYAGQGSRSGNEPAQSRDFSTSSSDRFRPVPPIASSASGRISGSAPGYPGYYPDQAQSFPTGLPSTPQQFQPAYPQDQRQQQSFGAYNADLMYNASPQTAQSSVYDAAQQFQSRQSASIQMVPEVPGQFFQNETATAPSVSALQQAVSSSSSIYAPQQSPGSRDLQPGFSSDLTMGGATQAASEGTGQESFPPPSEEATAGYALYQTTLRGTFQNIINGRLAEAGQSLSEASEWLLNHVEDLGLHVDNANLHLERMQLWDQFNTAWLSMAQKQKDMLESGQRIRLPHSIITQDNIKKMVTELHGLCDGIAKHGLVDYQYGVAENDITIFIEECLTLQESIEGINQGSGPGDVATGRAPP